MIVGINYKPSLYAIPVNFISPEINNHITEGIVNGENVYRINLTHYPFEEYFPKLKDTIELINAQETLAKHFTLNQ